MKTSKPKKTRQPAICKDCGSPVPLTWTPALTNPEGQSIFGHGLCSCGSNCFAIEANPPDQPEAFLIHSLLLFMLGYGAGRQAFSTKH